MGAIDFCKFLKYIWTSNIDGVQLLFPLVLHQVFLPVHHTICLDEP